MSERDQIIAELVEAGVISPEEADECRKNLTPTKIAIMRIILREPDHERQ